MNSVMSSAMFFRPTKAFLLRLLYFFFSSWEGRGEEPRVDDEKGFFFFIFFLGQMNWGFDVGVYY